MRSVGLTVLGRNAARRPIRRRLGLLAALSATALIWSISGAAGASVRCTRNVDGDDVIALSGDSCVAAGGTYQPGSGTGQISPGFFDAGNGFAAIGNGSEANALVTSPNTSTILTTAANGNGIYARTGGKVISTGTLSITTDATQAYGAYAYNNSTITLGPTTIQTNGDNAFGLYATGPASNTLNLNGNSIVANAATPAAAITTTDVLTITTGGQASSGAEADLNGTINLNGSTTTITINGAAFGLTANRGTINGPTSLSITELGDAGGGLNATNSGTISLTGSNIICTEGNGAIGIFAGTEGSVTLSGPTTVTTTGLGTSAGSASYGTGGVMLASYGVVSDGASSSVSLADATVTTSGAGAHGLYASDLANTGIGGNITVNGTLQVTTSGTAADGIRADAELSTITLNGATTVTVSGDNSAGIRITSGAEVTPGTSTVISATGANAFGIYLDSSSLSFNSPLTITTAQASSTGIQLTGTNPSVSVASGSSLNTIGTALAFVNASNFSASFTSTSLTNQSGALISVDPSFGTINLVNSTLFAGSGLLLNTTGGSSVTLSAINSALTGAITTDTSSSSTLSLSNGSSWTVTGNSVLTSLTNNTGAISFSAPAGGVFKTLTTGSYAGTGGTLTLNALLGATNATSGSDQLVINGGTATGSTTLALRLVGGSGGQTTGLGIPVVVAANGATTAPGAFQLSGPLALNYFTYSLVRAADQSFYLQSSAAVSPSSVSASLGGLALAHQSQLVTSRILGSILLGANEQINCANCISGFAAFGSVALGSHGRWNLTDDVTLLAGASFDQFSASNVNVTGAALAAASLRFDPADMGSSRPFFEIGASGSPYELSRYTRGYTGGATAYSAGATSVDRSISGFGRVGWVDRMSPRDEVAAYADFSHAVLFYGSYAEGASPTNPFPATIASGISRLDIGKISAQYTHLVGSNLEINVNAGFARGFSGGSALTANISGVGPVTGGSVGPANWLEFGGRLGYRLSEKLVVDGFVIGTLGQQPAGNTLHGGMGLRYAF